jgi:hypothetical protein
MIPRSKAVGRGTVSFQNWLEVLCVPGLGKNLISISAIENNGYEMERYSFILEDPVPGQLR